MNVLSLFDGMSCGRLALELQGFKVDRYFASEIDKHAMQVTQSRWPETVQLGDVTKVSYKNGELIADGQVIWKGRIDLCCAGSPCQGFSKAGKGLNFDDPRSKLFFEFVRILNEVKSENPDVIFLLENVEMLQEWQDVISKFVGISPIKINSTLVSAQNRVRLYWTNIAIQSDMFGHSIPGIPQPKDRGIVLRDILESEVDEKFYLSDKAMARIKRKNVNFQPQIDPDKTGTLNTKNNSGQLSVDSGTTLITDKVVVHSGYGRTGGIKQGGTGPLSREDGKTYCIDTNANSNRIEVVVHQRSRGKNEGGEHLEKVPTLTSNRWEHNHAVEFKSRIRRLTPIECERLQGVPDNYTDGVSDTQRYRMLGNGWQVDTIRYILSFIKG